MVGLVLQLALKSNWLISDPSETNFDDKAIYFGCWSSDMNNYFKWKVTLGCSWFILQKNSFRMKKKIHIKFQYIKWNLILLSTSASCSADIQSSWFQVQTFLLIHLQIKLFITIFDGVTLSHTWFFWKEKHQLSGASINFCCCLQGPHDYPSLTWADSSFRQTDWIFLIVYFSEHSNVVRMP